MSRILRLAVCAAVFSTSLGSQAIAAEPVAPTANARACAARYLKALDMGKLMKDTMEGMAPALMAQMPSAESVPEDVKRAILESVTETLGEIMPKMMADLEPAMAATFTEAELCAMAEFYDSPTGRSIMAKMPAFSQASMGATMKYVPLMQEGMTRRLCAKIDCKGGKPATRSSS